jgi:hypothetical protein
MLPKQICDIVLQFYVMALINVALDEPGFGIVQPQEKIRSLKICEGASLILAVVRRLSSSRMFY